MLRRFFKKVSEMVKCEEVRTAVEYAVMLALIIRGLRPSITSLGTHANKSFSRV